HRQHGVNVQALADPAGRLVWALPTPAGAIHDIRVTREHGIRENRAFGGIPCSADKGYQSAGPAVRGPVRDRALGERAFEQLKSWRLLRRVRCSTRRIGTVVLAVHTLLTCDYAGWKTISGSLAFHSCLAHE
ncbi:transposase family protein, partial [Streptomyces sp. CoH17]|uniref:transposase family protein n=1 Tax=Streptomyces sp. CoH17 TaxID=2992806 RepID=UPI002D1E42B6